MSAPMTMPAATSVATEQLQRRQWRIRGRVQGVGFRPFIYRLARAHQLTGSVLNDSAGVLIEAQGTPEQLMQFAAEIRTNKPASAVIQEMIGQRLRPRDGETTFAIHRSAVSQAARTEIAPDLATCPACRAELRDPHDPRRHGYPLINCTECGPRFSIVRDVPYDRANTSMAGFAMCEACRREYSDVTDRRFHAQPTACRECGPAFALVDARGPGTCADPVREAADRLIAGQVIAVKGIGGFHLAVRADDERAVQRLRETKHRLAKPFAAMVGDLVRARALVSLGARAAGVIASAAAPIVLAPRRADAPVARAVAPASHRLGVMLAYTPLHQLLFDQLGDRCPALVMTSANDSDEPLVFTDDEAASRLGQSCDAMLTHQRPIERPVDDSVVLDAGERPPIVIRRSRGYVPTPIPVPPECDLPGLCVGGELKSVVGVVRDGSVILSQHLGDLQHARTYANFKRATEDLLRLFDVRPEWVAHDMHPGYVSTLYARQLAAALRAPRVQVQHHYAHAVSALVEHGLTGPALAVVCDGTGYGPDGTAWGGELLSVDLKGYTRLAHLQKIRLAGGDAAAKQAWRSALSLLQAAVGDGFLDHPVATRLAPQPDQARFVGQMLRNGTNCVTSTSAGRVFDGVAALLGLCATNSFEAQAPLALEAAAAARVGQLRTAKRPLFELRGNGCMTVDLTPLVREILGAHGHGTPVEELAALFHDQFVAAWEAAVLRASDATGLICVVLSGGVFCNEIVDRELTERLTARGLHVLRHEIVPPNDGGLALGQAALAGFRARRAQKVRR
jgi:hydrogenase maturation protein HypF